MNYLALIHPPFRGTFFAKTPISRDILVVSRCRFSTKWPISRHLRLHVAIYAI